MTSLADRMFGYSFICSVFTITFPGPWKYINIYPGYIYICIYTYIDFICIITNIFGTKRKRGKTSYSINMWDGAMQLCDASSQMLENTLNHFHSKNIMDAPVV